MGRLIYGGVGFFVGLAAAGAVFLAWPNSPTKSAGSPSAPLSQPLEAAEDRFLDLDAHPQQAVRGAGHIGAKNERYSSCEKPPELVEYLGAPGNATYARRRDMNLFLVTTNVLATKDCSCSGKVIPASTLIAFEKRLMVEANATKVEELVTRPLHDDGRSMRRQVEIICGGEL